MRGSVASASSNAEKYAAEEARIVPTSGLALDQILELIQQVTQAGGTVARVHSGDPSLYGATHEQMRARLHEIAHINELAGSARWLARGTDRPEGGAPAERRSSRDRRRG